MPKTVEGKMRFKTLVAKEEAGQLSKGEEKELKRLLKSYERSGEPKKEATYA